MLSQSNVPAILFLIDPNVRVDKRFENHKDTAFFYFDEGFGNDTIQILIDNTVKFKGVVRSDAFIGFALLKAIPKTQRTMVTIKRNGQTFKSFAFHKNYSCLHLTYYRRQLSGTYTNRNYFYY
ncbi:hypothetical protein CNR22_00510 [Sphingobacteriaceae bacterium]|nr:hypothetical protein CNR22_00510 [Sphingobacteriaceae bacterium]